MRIPLPAAAFGAFLVLIGGCRSHPVEITVENQTGFPVRLLEVDYPNASFGADSLAPGASVRQSVHVTGSGPVKVQYTAPDRHQPQLTGPVLAEGQDGALEIVLLPGNVARYARRGF